MFGMDGGTTTRHLWTLPDLAFARQTVPAVGWRPVAALPGSGLTDGRRRVAKKFDQPGGIHLQTVQLMKRFPEGVSGAQIRRELEQEGVAPEELHHLQRRITELGQWFIIEKTATAETSGSNKRFIADKGQIGLTARAEALYAARGRCQRCGKSIETDGITLVVNSRWPTHLVDTEYSNDLWAVCERCGAGKTTDRVRPARIGARSGSRCCRMSTIGMGRRRGPHA